MTKKTEQSKVEQVVEELVSVKAEPAEANYSPGSEGLIGYEIDPTPNEHYTLAGVVAGLPTPETDKNAKKAAVEQAEKIAEKL